ncbi:MAG: hypothetical protein IGS03_06300 [Candidatus Sericytochromatia bacterium]|nr:hypothetical protein [Candidatus Sericytochromatia bacterium]
MPRFVYLGIFLAVALVPFLFFGLLSSGSAGYSSGRHYSHGPSFLFMHFGSGYRGSTYRSGPSRGRGFSGGSFRGGSSRFGK